MTYPQVVSPDCITSLFLGICLVTLVVKALPCLPLLLIFAKLQHSAVCHGQAEHNCKNSLHLYH